MMRLEQSNDTSQRPRTSRRRRLLPGIAALLLLMGSVGTALADIPEPPRTDDDDEDVTGTCLPEKDPGDDCNLPNGDDGVCQDAKEECGFDSAGTVYCHVCEDEGCSIAGAGMSSPPSAGWLALGALAALGFVSRRRRTA
jgi:MYXO-CTERM domain-containing protein